MTAEQLRRWASQCEVDARKMKTSEDRERLLRLHAALMSLANGEDWVQRGRDGNGATLADGGERQH